MKQCSVESRVTTRCGDTSSSVIQRCIETVAHAAACTQGAACPRQPECRKMMDVLRHARACTKRTTCTVCQQLMALCVTHARACTVDSSVCRVPFCAELRRHIERRQTLQRYQQHQMEDRRRALMTGMGNDDFVQTDDKAELQHGNSSCNQWSTGKGGETAHVISGGDSASNSNPTNITKVQEHSTANTDAVCRNSCTVLPAAAGSLLLEHADLKTSRSSFSQITNDLSTGSAVGLVDLRNSSVPKTAASSVGDRKFAESQSAGDGPALEVFNATESSARHQIVVGCLRVLKRLHPSMSKQNLLQLLCHCSRQQLAALQDKVDSF